MKDIVIKGKWIKRELIVLAAAFLLAVILNIVGIAVHGTRWIELLSQLHVMIILALVIYVLLLFVRGVYYLVSLPFRRTSNE